MIINEFCSICGTSNWHNLDYLRDHEYWYQAEKRHEDEPVGFKICKECGYITYDYIEQDRLDLMYQAERPIMNANNMITGNRKNTYHKIFWERSDDMLHILSNPGKTFLDIGCAQGELLRMLKDDYGIEQERLYGTEANKSFLTWARNEYGLKNVGREVQPGVKFDFISYYHVLEHIQYPEKSLAQAVEMLKDDGLMYISIPYWLDGLEIFDGSIANNFENVYHLNHVNVFTLQSFQNLLNNAGLEVIQTDSEIYAYTVLCQKAPKKPIVKENWEENVKLMERDKQAIDLANAGKIEEALAICPKYPDAYLLYSLNKDNMKEFEPQVTILKRGLKACGDNIKLKFQLAKVYFQWDEQRPDKLPFISNNLLEAEKLLKEIHAARPDNEDIMYFMALMAGKHRKQYDHACALLDRCIYVNPSKWAECNNMKAYFRMEQG